MKKVLFTLCLLSVSVAKATAQDPPPVVLADPPPIATRMTAVELELARMRADVYTMKYQLDVLLTKDRNASKAVAVKQAPVVQPAPVVAASAPFEQPVVWDTTPTTSVTTVVPISTRSVGFSATGLTYTLVPAAGVRGTTNCGPNGCAATTTVRRGLFGWR